MKKNKTLTRVEVTLNCDPRELLKAAFEHCIKDSKEKGLNKNAQYVTLSMMYELANIICPNSEEFLYSLFTKEFEWMD